MHYLESPILVDLANVLRQIIDNFTNNVFELAIRIRRLIGHSFDICCVGSKTRSAIKAWKKYVSELGRRKTLKIFRITV